MAQFFLKNGIYFETITDLPQDQWPAGASPVAQRPSPNHQPNGSGGWVYVQPPSDPVAVPQSISKLQAKLAAGPAIVAQIEAFMTDPQTPWAMQMAWQDAGVLLHGSQTVDELAYILGWSAAQKDAFFIRAAAILV